MEIYPTTPYDPKTVHATHITGSHVYYKCDNKDCAKKFHIHGSAGDSVSNRIEGRVCEHVGKRGKATPPSEEVMIIIDKNTVRRE